MKFASSLLVLGGAALATAHYTFDALIVNGQQRGGGWQYVRQHSRGYMPTKWDEILRTDFRCNDNALSGSKTQVFTVKPGDKVAIKQAFGGTGMLHPGPTQVYMSKAPGSVGSYDGSGDWFKVHQSLVCRQKNAQSYQNDAWCMWGEDRIEFTIPQTVPNGEYLARVEHIGLHGAHVGEAEFYYVCAQIKVEGSSASGIPGPTARIPGVYKTSDAAVRFSVWSGSTSYPHTPGIAVCNGGTIRGNANGSVGFTTTTVGGGSSGGGGSGGGSGGGGNTGGGSGAGAPLYGQCGGNGWTGPKTCAQGTCKVSNEWYSQCVP